MFGLMFQAVSAAGVGSCSVRLSLVVEDFEAEVTPGLGPFVQDVTEHLWDKGGH